MAVTHFNPTELSAAADENAGIIKMFGNILEITGINGKIISFILVRTWIQI